MVTWISALFLALGVSVGLGIRRRDRRRASRVRERRVEQPNSFYSAPGVRRMVDLERWERIPVAQLHALNRDEVRRLLHIAEAAGPETLSPGERQFLDNMARS